MVSHVLGIDLGTTNSVVAYADDARVRVLRDGAGRLLTPSIVAFPPSGEVKVGHAARELRLRDPHNTIYSVKRLLGRPFDSPLVQEARQKLPFALEKGPTGGVTVRVRGETLALPEISSFILRHLRQLAERALQDSCGQTVITVPANFNELQRMATRDAAHIAGLEVLRILNEPTAAALAYGYRANQAQRIAVYDFGGGTFDISILELSGDVIEVVSTAGDSSLGGDDLDRAIADRIAARYTEQLGASLISSQQTFARLVMAGERLKCQLSKRDVSEVTIKKLAGSDGQSRDFSFRIEQRELEELADPYIERTFGICEEALRLASLRPTQLDAVLLVGGQTRMPRVRLKVSEFFGMQAQCSVDPDLAVAQGAAIQGYALSGAASRKIPSLQPALDLDRMDPEAAFGEEPGRTHQSLEGAFDEEPTAVSRRISSMPAGPDVKLPSLRPDRPGAGLSQTLSGMGNEATAPGPSAEVSPELSAAARELDQQSPGDAGFKTAPGRPRARGQRPLFSSNIAGNLPSLERRAVPPRAPTREERAGDPELSDEDEAELPPVLRSSQQPSKRADDVMSTLLDSPRAKARGKSPSSGQPIPAPPAPKTPPKPALLEARALARQGKFDGALKLYGELLLQDPNDPRLLQEARTLREMRAARAKESSAPALSLDNSDDGAHERPTAAPPRRDSSDTTEALPRSDTGEGHWTEAQEEELSVLMPSLPPPHGSSAPAISSQLPAPRSRAPLLLDVTPHTLNVETVDGFCEALIERNAPIPTEQTRIFTTSQDQQAMVSVRVSQGESRRTEDNYVLGQIDLLGLRRAPRGEVQIAVTFVIDADGTLSARALDQATGRSQELRVRLTGAIEPAELERMRASGRLRAN
jgi:molecular chaperone DnaK